MFLSPTEIHYKTIPELQRKQPAAAHRAGCRDTLLELEPRLHLAMGACQASICSSIAAPVAAAVTFLRAAGRREEHRKIATAVQLRFGVRRRGAARASPGTLERLAGRRLRQDGVLIITAQRASPRIGF